MKQRKNILCALCIFYGIVTAGCLLYHTAVSSPKETESNPLQASVSAKQLTEEASSEADLSEPASSEAGTEEVPMPDTESPKNNEEAESADNDAQASQADAVETADTTEQEEAEDVFTPIPFTCKTKPSLNIRDTPSTDGKVVAKIKFGATGEITDIVDDEWAAVRCHNTTGYCAIRYLAYGDALEALTTSGTVVILKGCYVRSDPNSHSSDSILLTAKSGETYSHVPEMDTPYFYAIQLPDKKLAYVCTDYCTVKNNSSEE